MLARLARYLLLFELAAYALIAVGLLRLGVSGAAVVVAILCCALLYRIGFVVSTFVVAAAVSPAAERHAHSAAGHLLLVARETLWTSLAYGAFMTFPRAFGQADSRLQPEAGLPPVLLVPGYCCNGGVWASMRRFLERRGVATYTHDLEPVFTDIDAYVAGLQARIEAVCKACGAQRLVVVGHSMGGLALRAYLRACGGSRVARLVTLGTGHHGSLLARLAIGANGREMEPDSAWLVALAAAERGAPGAPVTSVTSIYSCDDNLVVPRESAALAGARNLRLSGIGHFTLLFSRSVQEQVLREVLECGKQQQKSGTPE